LYKFAARNIISREINWLEPQVELAKNTGIPNHKLNEIGKIVEKYADEFKKQYREHIGKRIDD
jgi:hypothetical protein